MPVRPCSRGRRTPSGHVRAAPSADPEPARQGSECVSAWAERVRPAGGGREPQGESEGVGTVGWGRRISQRRARAKLWDQTN